jgi:hypothetical protein
VQTVGSLGSLATLVAVPLLAIMILRQRRLTRQVRLQLQTNLAREADLSAAVAASVVVPPIKVSRGASVEMERRNYRVRRGRAIILLPSIVVALVLAATAAGLLLTQASV